jgi:hypothetical protein
MGFYTVWSSGGEVGINPNYRCISPLSPDSSVVEHLHGKQKVEGSIPFLGIGGREIPNAPFADERGKVRPKQSSLMRRAWP